MNIVKQYTKNNNILYYSDLKVGDEIKIIHADEDYQHLIRKESYIVVNIRKCSVDDDIICEGCPTNGIAIQIRYSRYDTYSCRCLWANKIGTPLRVKERGKI